MDIAAVLDKIRPGAAWRMSDTYENLVSTWEDEQTCPTMEELKTSWEAIQKNAIHTEINAERDRREKAGFTYNGNTFDSDEISVIRINSAVNTAVAAVLSGSSFSVNWTTADNKTVVLTAQQFLEMSAALAQHSNDQHVRARGLKDKLDAATTEDEIAAVKTELDAWKAEA